MHLGGERLDRRIPRDAQLRDRVDGRHDSGVRFVAGVNHDIAG